MKRECICYRDEKTGYRLDVYCPKHDYLDDEAIKRAKKRAEDIKKIRSL